MSQLFVFLIAGVFTEGADMRSFSLYTGLALFFHVTNEKKLRAGIFMPLLFLTL